MSVRAAEAYEQGEMPISRWTKTAIIQAVKGYCFDFDLAYDPDIENNTKAELVKEFLEYKSWHHSSRTAREVEFFGLNEDLPLLRESHNLSAKCARITDISHNFSMRPKDESLTHDGENTNR